MRKNQRVAEMAEEVLERQARDRAERTWEPLEDAFEAVLGTEAGRQLEELRDGPHGDERRRSGRRTCAESGSRSKEQSEAKRGERGLRREYTCPRSLDRPNGGADLLRGAEQMREATGAP